MSTAAAYEWPRQYSKRRSDSAHWAAAASTHPGIALGQGEIEPAPGTQVIARMDECRERGHDPMLGTVLVVGFTLGVLDPPDLLLGDRDVVPRGELHAEGLTIRFVLEMRRLDPVAIQVVLPRLLSVVDEQTDERVREREGQRTASPQHHVDMHPEVHGLADVVVVTTGPRLVVVRGTPSDLETAPVLQVEPDATDAEGLIDQVEELLDGMITGLHNQLLRRHEDC